MKKIAKILTTICALTCILSFCVGCSEKQKAGTYITTSDDLQVCSGYASNFADWLETMKDGKGIEIYYIEYDESYVFVLYKERQ